MLFVFFLFFQFKGQTFLSFPSHFFLKKSRKRWRNIAALLKLVLPFMCSGPGSRLACHSPRLFCSWARLASPAPCYFVSFLSFFLSFLTLASFLPGSWTVWTLEWISFHAAILWAAPVVCTMRRKRETKQHKLSTFSQFDSRSGLIHLSSLQPSERLD